MDKGWIKLYRKLLDNDELMRDHNALVLFIFILCEADRNGTCKVSRFATSYRLNMKPSTFRNSLLRLSSSDYFGGQLLDTRPGKRYTLVSILNWDKYQAQQEVKTFNEGQQKATYTRKKNQDIITTNEVDDKIIKFLRTVDKVKNPEAYLGWLKKQVKSKYLIKLLDIDFYQWPDYIELWKKK